MKKMNVLYYVAAFALLVFSASCEKDPEIVKTYDVTVQLDYPDGFEPAADVRVTLRNTLNGNVSEASTDPAGAASFTVVAGIYEATASEERTDDMYRYLINGMNSNIAVTDQWTNTPVDLPLTVTTIAQPVEGDVSPYGKLIIKEVYVGGCQKDDGSGAWTRDSYVIIYNNSTQPAAIDNLAFGTIFPHNAHATAYFWVNEAWTYAAENWLPSVYGAWQITNSDTLAPGEQRVIVIYQAIDHTPVYSNSVNLANADYYVAYDPTSGYNNANYHIPPSELIPTSHYLKAYRLSGVTSNAWTISINSPAFYIFAPPTDITLSDFTSDPDNLTTHGTSALQATLKVPRTWIIDGIEVFQDDAVDRSKVRFTPDVNVGYIPYTNNQGYSLYRNVDKTATEAILANAGKLVYNYNLGVDDSTDPSGIDAEASIRNGAHIIYKETNNTTNDFHQRSKVSLRD
ncbi:MAG: DUF4876 domain-containing protein [Prevotellaceae bacterium]|jgi:hypothetical protein|nr:DUF4876 domain-containing protein [Prevotellaceae bacterium]